MASRVTTGTTYRQGKSNAIGTIIDGYLEQSENDLLYARWKSEWPEPLAFSGGIKAITCEMILEIPEEDLVKALGKKRAGQFLQVAKANAGR